jgi:hypothetical protein
MDNPLSGSKRGWTENRSVYERIFNGSSATANAKVRGRFTHGGVQHYLSITDPLVERQYLPGQNGAFPVGRLVLIWR